MPYEATKKSNWTFGDEPMKSYGWLLLGTCLIVFGCAKPEINEVILETQLQDAQQAINDAAELEAEVLVPEEFGRAVKLFGFARDSHENGDSTQSFEFACQAELVGEVATAKARQHHARQKVVTIREQIYQQIITAHEYELEIGRIHQAIIEEQLARALRARDVGEQQKSGLSKEIADLETRLRQAELRTPIEIAESLANITSEIYPPIKGTADYERSQAAIASALRFIERGAFTEAENVIAEVETLVNSLYQIAVQHQQAEMTAKMDARIAIAQVEVILQRAQVLNATQHAPKQFQEASMQLQQAKQQFDVGRYEQVKQSAEQAQRLADAVVAASEVQEYQQRAQQELNVLITQADQAVESVGKKISAQEETQVPQLEPQLYKLANSAYDKAISAFASKEYQLAIEASKEADDYLQRAITNAVRVTSAKSELVTAAKLIPKVTNVIEQRESVLVRINGNVFAHGSTQLQKEFFGTFTALSKVLRTSGFDSYPVHIEVHTSSLGTANVNQKLSMERADTIKKYLMDEGRVDANRMTAAGLGETRPIVNDGADKEERNRRIDIIIKTN